MFRPPLEILEVSPRDGLQNEPELVGTADKLRLIDLAAAAGFRRIEASSFVNPAKVPQMADAAEVFGALAGRADAVFVALALNPRGVDRAIAAGAREINYVFCASEAFSIRNNGASVAETLQPWPDVAARCAQAGVRLTATVSTAFGCPFEGEVDPGRVAAVAAEAAAAGPAEIILADTIGVATPADVKARFRAAAAAIGPGVPLRAHFHNTRNTALANAVAAVEEGVRTLDGSLAGIGGCPFAPGAAGNVPSEDLVYMFERMGMDTGVDLDRAIAAARFIGGVLGRPTPGMVSRAGGFPKPAA